jgi:flagellar motor switch protein FliG
MIAMSEAASRGIRKAAILVASLDQAASDLLLDQLPPSCADRVRQAVLDMDEIDPDEQRRVIEEFQRRGTLMPVRAPSGIDLDGSAASLTVETLAANPEPIATNCSADTLRLHTVAETGATASDPCAAKPTEEPLSFDFLREAGEANLAQLLRGERPQAIALVLSHLPPERAGLVLAHFSSAEQVEVVRRLVDLEHADPRTLGELEQTIRARLSRQFVHQQTHRCGSDAVVRILAACSREVAGDILDNLAEHDEQLAGQLGRPSLAFDNFDQLDDAALLEVVRTADPAVVHAALLGAPPSLVERILRRMSPQAAKRLRRTLDCPGPFSLRDVDEARRQMAALAGRLARARPSKTALAA